MQDEAGKDQSMEEAASRIFAIELPIRWEIIYSQINGLNESDMCEWVKDESSMDGALGPLTEQIYEARSRLCERTGLDPDTDPDFALLISGAEDFARACGKLMYQYGYLDGMHGE